jgi:hypothetical protein
MVDLADPAFGETLIEAYINEHFLGERRPLRDAIKAYLPKPCTDKSFPESCSQARKRAADGEAGSNSTTFYHILI